MKQSRPHFLVVTYPAQGHINPAQAFAGKLVGAGARVTFSTAVSGHRRMFPLLPRPDQETQEGSITYIPYSDGNDNGVNPSGAGAGGDDNADSIARYKTTTSKSLAAILHRLAADGRPVTSVIYTIVIPWVASVARDFGIPSAMYWIQPATVFAIYYHYFHGYKSLISSHADDPTFSVKFPGMSPLQIRDLPSFLIANDVYPSGDPYSAVLSLFKETFDVLDEEIYSGRKPAVLLNTCTELEQEAVSAMEAITELRIFPVGPTISPDRKTMFKTEHESRYMEFLDSKPDRSVVYVSFGSLSVMNKTQVVEISKGLKESGRPYLWVLRKDNKDSEGIDSGDVAEIAGEGLVVEWCSQLQVLNHAAIGCFVTHCGWNSTLESLISGVPMVAVPQWTDQGTNARLVSEICGTAVRAEIDRKGFLRADELKRCLEMVMGEKETSKEITCKASAWKAKTEEAIAESGSSNLNLTAFLEEMANQP